MTTMPAKHSKLVWFAAGLLAAIGMAAATIRIVLLARGSRGGAVAAVDDTFATHAGLTLIHIVPGLLFLVVAPLQFVPTIRGQRPNLHRWIGYSVFVLAAIIGISGFAMTAQMAIGGLNERAAILTFDSLFLLFGCKGYLAARKREFRAHREWMIGMFGVGLGIATTRPIVGAFFATSRWTHLTPHEFFGIAFWLGFSWTLFAAEGWLIYTKERAIAQ